MFNVSIYLVTDRGESSSLSDISFEEIPGFSVMIFKIVSAYEMDLLKLSAPFFCLCAANSKYFRLFRKLSKSA